jgi:hypothetical protein
MHDGADLRVRAHRLFERAAVLADDVAAGLASAVGYDALFAQYLGDFVDPLADVLAFEPIGVLARGAFADLAEQRRHAIFAVLELQFVKNRVEEHVVSLREEALSGMRHAEDGAGFCAAPPSPALFDETVALEPAEVLAHGVDRKAMLGGKLGGRSAALLFEGFEYSAPSGLEEACVSHISLNYTDSSKDNQQ